MPRNAILLRGDWIFEKNSIADTYPVIPGHLVEVTDGGHQPHTTAGGKAPALFIQHMAVTGATGTIRTIDDTIPAGDSIVVIHAQKGAVINAITAETIDQGEYVQSGGDGTVVPFDSGEIVGQAQAASDLSGSVGRVEIIII